MTCPWGLPIDGWIVGAEWWALIGGALEVWGLLLVAKGINRKQRKAGRPTIPETLQQSVKDAYRNLLVRLGLRKAVGKSLSIEWDVEVPGGGEVTPRGYADRGGTVEEQLSQLKKDFLLLD